MSKWTSISCKCQQLAKTSHLYARFGIQLQRANLKKFNNPHQGKRANLNYSIFLDQMQAEIFENTQEIENIGHYLLYE